MRLDLVDFKLFIFITEAGSITRGAERSNLALASASERLRKIEEEASVSLFLRHSRGVSLTEAGEVFERYARQIIYQYDLLKRELKAFNSNSNTSLQLYANTSASTQFLPSKIAPWMIAHPNLDINLEERTSTDIINIISAGLGEAGIVSDSVNAHSLILEPIAKDHLILIVPMSHRLAKNEEISFKDIILEPFIGLYMGSALQEHINYHAKAMGQELTPRIRMNTFEGICEMVEKGIGIGILPEALATKYQSRFVYKKLILKDDWAKRQLCMCYKSWSDLTPPMKDLLSYLKDK